MLKFFRTIRKKLIEHPSKGRAGDKVRKPASPAGRYLLYAIGEIMLVVIGKPCPVKDYISVETIDGPYVHRAVGTEYSGIWILPQSIWSASDLR